MALIPAVLGKRAVTSFCAVTVPAVIHHASPEAGFTDVVVRGSRLIDCWARIVADILCALPPKAALIVTSDQARPEERSLRAGRGSLIRDEVPVPPLVGRRTSGP